MESLKRNDDDDSPVPMVIFLVWASFLLWIGIRHDPVDKGVPIAGASTQHQQAMGQKILAAKSGDILINKEGRLYVLGCGGTVVDNHFNCGTLAWDLTNCTHAPKDYLPYFASQAYNIVPQDDVAAYAKAAACMLRRRSVIIDGPASSCFTCD